MAALMKIKGSSYVRWSKQKHDIRYNLARSGVPAPPADRLTSDPAALLEDGSHEDGWPPLLDALAERYGVDSRQIVPAHGTSMANHLAMAAVLEEGDHVLVEKPVYDPLALLPRYLHAEVSHFERSPENGFQPDPDQIAGLANGRTRLIVLSDLHNPSGARLDPGLLEKIIGICEERGITLLVDEVYLEFLYPEGVRTSAAKSDRVITTRSLTKAYGLDRFRLGWIIAPDELAGRIRRLRDLYAITTTFPSERLALEVVRNAKTFLEETNGLLEENRRIVEQFIEGKPELEWTPPPGGSVGFVHFTEGGVDRLVSEAERKYGTIVAPGRFFGREEWFRLGWGLSTGELEESLGRLSRAIDEH